ncbi:postmeiotic segregation increased 2 (S. cerevisiae) (predicted), isoform CRA_b, partial [Rattus norvegicus]
MVLRNLIIVVQKLACYFNVLDPFKNCVARHNGLCFWPSYLGEPPQEFETILSYIGETLIQGQKYIYILKPFHHVC